MAPISPCLPKFIFRFLYDNHLIGVIGFDCVCLMIRDVGTFFICLLIHLYVFLEEMSLASVFLKSFPDDANKYITKAWAFVQGKAF